MDIPSQDERRNWLNDQKDTYQVDVIPKYGFTQKMFEEAEESYLLELYFASTLCSNTSLISLIFQKVEGMKKFTRVRPLIEKSAKIGMIDEDLMNDLLEFQTVRNRIVHKKSPASEYIFLHQYFERTNPDLYQQIDEEGNIHAYMPYFLATQSFLLYFRFCESWWKYQKEKVT